MLKSHVTRVFIVTLFGALLLLRPAGAQAAPTVSSAVNGASYANMNLPNGKLAPGMLFDVFGSGLGPGTIAFATPYPFTTSVANTSVRVMIGGVPRDCLIVFSLNTQVAAILPDDTPLGNGTLVVTFNGQASAPLNVTVVTQSFGIFTINQGGYGQGVATSPFAPFTANGDPALFQGTKSFNPDDLLDIWGTGLGSCLNQGFPCNEANAPAPGDLPMSILVYVGLTQAQISYKGRSGCCSGVDQIRITVPNNQFGCEIPLYIVVNGVTSNFTWIAISPSGTTCQDAPVVPGLTDNQWNNIINSGVYRAGSIAVLKSHADAPQFQNNTGSVGAQFYRFTNIQSYKTSRSVQPAAGICVINVFPAPIVGGGLATGMNAGTQLSAVTPMGTYIAPQAQPGGYGVAFLPGVPTSTGVVGDGTLPLPGMYTVNGTGGPDVGVFSGSVNFPGIFNWTNRSSISVVNRTQPLTVTWTGGAAGALAYIHGRSLATQDQTTGAEFYCYEDATKGTFTVPAGVLSALPVSIVTNGRQTGILDVYEFSLTPLPTIPSLDSFSISYEDGDFKTGVSYQ